VFSTLLAEFRERNLISNAFKRAVFEGGIRVILDKNERENPLTNQFFFFFGITLYEYY
jgi:hypothetical protein